MPELISRKVVLPFKENNHPVFSNVSYVNQVNTDLFIIDFGFADPLELNSIGESDSLTAQVAARIILTRESLKALVEEIGTEI